MGWVEAHLAPADPQEFEHGGAVPGQVKEILFKQTAIGQGGVGKQEVTADHQIEAASIERQVGKAGCLVALGMDQSIGQKLLQGFEFAAA